MACDLKTPEGLCKISMNEKGQCTEALHKIVLMTHGYILSQDLVPDIVSYYKRAVFGGVQEFPGAFPAIEELLMGVDKESQEVLQRIIECVLPNNGLEVSEPEIQTCLEENKSILRVVK